MLRFTTRSRTRISSRLAVFAALTLVITTLAGMDKSVRTGYAGSQQIAEVTKDAIEQPTTQAPVRNALRKSKVFKMSLFLFRLN